MMNRFINMKFDKGLLLAVILLLVLGIVIIYTGTSPIAMQKGLPAEFFTISHIKKVLLGLFCMTLAVIVDYSFWYKFARPLFAVLLLAMILVLFQDAAVKGASRWLSIAGYKVQPSEFMKLGIFCLLSVKLVEAGDKINDFKVGFLRPLILVGIVCVMLILQPNFSMVLMILATSLVVIYVAGVPMKHLMKLLALCPLIVVVAYTQSYRSLRIKAWLDPDKYPDVAHQLRHSLIALGNGGITGTGIGQGTQKLGYVPESYKDAAFSILGEELGFIGAFLMLSLFAFLAYRGFAIARSSSTRFGKYLAVALTSSICLNMIFHVCVCTGLFPTTGQPLPFISFGGTSLVTTLISVGILLNISKSDTGQRIQEIPINSTIYSTRYL
jgi:cell division protein FtsW